MLAVLATESQGTGNLALFPVIVLAFGPLGGFAARSARPPRPSRGDHGASALVVALLVTAAYPLAESILRRGSTMAVHHLASMRREPALDAVIGRALVPQRTSTVADRYTALWHGPEATKVIVQGADSAFAGGLNATEPAMSLAWAREVAAMGELVRRRNLVHPPMRVTTIGYVEPFGRLLGASPTPGTKLWLDPLRTVGKLTVDEARAYLAKADAVFVQTCPLNPTLREMTDTSFLAALRERSNLADATACYEVWLRA
ncbi:hypothetical protein QA634_08970 [Methylobacterium sp. CB376]|uniref:hypothetical protein n=1 Tax=unclassified Methylobacterium TaxID=2615210 RepID=UPI0005BB84C1|nr:MULTISPECIES: hypothetical protein [Methylobacterium]WFT81972.1 hypothetical protein QA634_08970 [Methylobacterium nodulans]